LLRHLPKHDPRLLIGPQIGEDAAVIDAGDRYHRFWRRARPEHMVIKLLDLKAPNVTILPDSKGRILPVLSPDGRYIAATSFDSQKLMLFDVTAQRWSELAQTSVGFTEWSADSRYIYFDTGLTKDRAIFRLRVADHKLEQVANLKDFRRAVFVGVPWLGLTPEGAPLLLRDTGTHEVYALDFEAP